MILKVYSVYDSVAQVYSQPFYSMNLMTAQRIMKNCVSNPEHTYGLNPEDFALYEVGEFDDSKGVITPSHEKQIDLITLSNKEIKLEAVQ